MTAPTQVAPCAKVDAWRQHPDAALIAHDFGVTGGWLAFARVADYAEWVKARDEKRVRGKRENG